MASEVHPLHLENIELVLENLMKMQVASWSIGKKFTLGGHGQLCVEGTRQSK
jgi:hypothetical protein